MYTKLSKIPPVYIVGLIMIVSVCIRVINISIEELWYDEIFGVLISHFTGSIYDIVEYSKESYYTPLYYIVLRYWTYLFDTSATSVRLLSIAFSSASIPIIYLLGKKMFTKKIGLLATLFMMLSPLHVEFAQEARPYAIISFFALLSMYFFWQFILKPAKNRNLVIILVINLLGVYMHYDYFIVIVTQVIIIAFINIIPSEKINAKIILKKFLLWWGALALLFLPWVIYSFGANISGVSYALQEGSAIISDIFLKGDLWFSPINKNERLQSFLVFVGQVAVVSVMVIAFRKSYKRYTNEKKLDNELLALLFIVLWYIGSLAFYLISPLSAQYTPNWQRHILIFSPPLYIALSYALMTQRRKEIRIFAIGIIFVSMLLPLIMVLKDDGAWAQQHNNKVMFDYIEEHEMDGDLVFVPGRLWEVVVLYYYNGRSQISGFLPLKDFNSITARSNYYVPSLDEVTYAYKRPAGDLFVGIDELPQLVEPFNRVWLFHPPQETHIFNWFIEHWEFVECPEVTCSRMYLFENPNK
jgi:uncharacterized membrane protein